MEKSADLQLIINDQNGHLIWQKKIKSAADRIQVEYNAELLIPGIYLISISNAEGHLTKSFTKS
ncbi:MAG: hypothetical protein IPM92_15290 [Saprospiraceae bacterium]|nr:hypothetical protein [Saprospiraceae bacterium]